MTTGATYKDAVVIGGAALLAVLAFYLVRKIIDAVPKIGEAAGAVLDKVNPASTGNLAYGGINTVARTATGGAASGGEDTVGGVLARFREWVSGDDAAIAAMKRGGDPYSATGYQGLTAADLEDLDTGAAMRAMERSGQQGRA